MVRVRTGDRNESRDLARWGHYTQENHDNDDKRVNNIYNNTNIAGDDNGYKKK
jgi:hypothetical protein